MLAWMVCGALWAADWPRYRGATGDGTVTETSGFEEGHWPPEGALWTADVGRGASSPLVVDGKVYVMGWRDGKDSLHCLDLQTGKPVWRKEYPCPKYSRHHAGDESIYDCVSSTPTIDPAAGLIFTLSIDGDLNCWRCADGEHLWEINLIDRYSVPQRPTTGGGLRDYGYTSSPLLIGDLLIVEAGAPQGNLVGLDKLTGRAQWFSESDEPAGHTAGPVPITVGGVPCVAVVTLRKLLVIELAPGREGRTLAEYPWQTDYANNIVGAAVDGEHVLLSSGYNLKKTVKVKINPGNAEKVWEAPRYTKVCIPVIRDGYVYFAWERLYCLDYETGREIWDGGRCGTDASCVLTADDRVIVFGKKRLALVDSGVRSPSEYRELSAKEGLLAGYCWPHLAVADGRLLLKDAVGNLVCLKIGD